MLVKHTYSVLNHYQCEGVGYFTFLFVYQVSQTKLRIYLLI